MTVEIRNLKFPALSPVLCLISFFLFISCSHHEETIPSNILSKDKMVAVLVDIHLAEAAADNRSLNLEQINAEMANKYKELFIKHDITFDQFKTSYNYYLEHADLLAAIYTEVVNDLSTGDSRVNANRKIPRTRIDSLRQVDVRIPDSTQKK